MYNVFENIKNDIKELNGKTVKIFGQPTTVDTTVNEYTINILDVLNSLGEYVINTNDYIDYYYDDEVECDEEYCIFDEVDTDNVDEVLDILEKHGYISQDNCKCDNSYNYSSPINHDFDFNIYNSCYDNSIYVEFKVHRYGDIRCNYTDTVLLKFDNDYEFFEILSENNIYTSITVDNKEYEINIDILSDGIEVYNNDGCYMCTVYGDDYEDIANGIKENIA